MALKAGYKGFKTLGPGLDYDSVTGHLFLNGESDISLDNLKDVSIDTPVDGDILIYDSTTETWYNEQIDSDPTEDSSKPVSSGGVFEALNEIQDEIEDIWENNAKTGVHQLFDLASAVVTAGTGTTATKTSTGIRVQTTSNGTYRVGYAQFRLPQNADLTVKGTYTAASGMASVTMSYSDDGTNWTPVVNDGWTAEGGGETTTTQNIKYVGNTKTHPYFRFAIYCTRATSETGDMTFSNILAKFTADTVETVTDYAETNLQLTQNKVDNSVVGNVENGTTASQSYAVGENFIKDGKFCTCISAITSGGTFTLNTNYVEGTIADALGAVPITITPYQNISFVSSQGKKINKLIVLNIEVGATITCDGNSAVQVASIPSEFAPSIREGFVAINSDATIVARGSIDNQGRIYVKTPTAQSNFGVFISIAYTI